MQDNKAVFCAEAERIARPHSFANCQIPPCICGRDDEVKRIAESLEANYLEGFEIGYGCGVNNAIGQG